jgi:hypothetical protein
MPSGRRSLHQQQTRGSPLWLGSEPIASVSDPPTEEENRNRGNDSPSQRQREIRNQAENRKQQPEDLAFHCSNLWPFAPGWRGPHLNVGNRYSRFTVAIHQHAHSRQRTQCGEQQYHHTSSQATLRMRIGGCGVGAACRTTVCRRRTEGDCQEELAETACPSIHWQYLSSAKMPSHTTVIACQYHAVTSTVIWRDSRRLPASEIRIAHSRTIMPPIRCRACSPVRRK